MNHSMIKDANTLKTDILALSEDLYLLKGTPDQRNIYELVFNQVMLRITNFITLHDNKVAFKLFLASLPIDTALRILILERTKLDVIDPSFGSTVSELKLH